MYQNRFWQRNYGWDDDGSPDSWAAALDDTSLIDSGDPAVDVSADPLDATGYYLTPYCTDAGTNSYGDPLANCTFNSESWDDYLLDQGYPCNCTEDECDETSPACCDSCGCPVCSCNEDECTPDSPACCADDSCRWATTAAAIQHRNRTNKHKPDNKHDNKHDNSQACQASFTRKPLSSARQVEAQ